MPNIHYLAIALFAGMLSAPPPSVADDGGGTVETRADAKFAKMKARMRAYQAEQEASDNYDPYALSALDTAGCDINIGNVVLDSASDSPDEVVVFIDGDIIQSNNCR